MPTLADKLHGTLDPSHYAAVGQHNSHHFQHLQDVGGIFVERHAECCTLHRNQDSPIPGQRLDVNQQEKRLGRKTIGLPPLSL